ncbi:zinc-dependent peptidase [Synoicihabitans lomoniglobus]|uniref:Zinc-dependent peptidase n=1 Tax=Synoicihabitans lomoniglobus TaxID=2909285 RepID=A0AAE9ZXK2_9BACT|nr:zinc-dependent peptidase [Opitutaceae bacterium LMO-M01]WED65124.1 zinc-dependent peptidase [Opitutaceae bacterium LMO-M01]
MSFWARLATWFDPPEQEPVTFDPAWIAVLEANIPVYARLPAALQQQLHERITGLVHRVHFEACGGLELTDEMVLTIAGQAGMLVLSETGIPFPNLRTVLVYPAAYRATETLHGPAGIVMQREVVRLGQSSTSGTVVLAWNAVQQGARNCFDGHNVTFHEFAHQLDQAHGGGDGIPRLGPAHRYARWTQVITAGHARLERMAAAGKRNVLDVYGATNLAEFFAVATEAFFEKPRQLKRKQPALYAELETFYQLDPATWFSQG